MCSYGAYTTKSLSHRRDFIIKVRVVLHQNLQLLIFWVDNFGFWIDNFDFWVDNFGFWVDNFSGLEIKNFLSGE